MTIDTEDVIRIGKHALAGAAAALLLAIWVPVLVLLIAEGLAVGGYAAYKNMSREKGDVVDVETNEEQKKDE